jgi:hypothetical protein
LHHHQLAARIARGVERDAAREDSIHVRLWRRRPRLFHVASRMLPMAASLLASWASTWAHAGAGFVGCLLQLGRCIDGLDRGRQPILRGGRNHYPARQRGAHCFARFLKRP